MRVDPHRSRLLNRTIILRLLRDRGELSGYDVAKRTGLSRTAAYNVMEELVASGVVQERLGRSRGGRRPVLYRLNPEAGFVIGVDVGGARIRAEAFSLREESVVASEVPVVGSGEGGILGSVLEAVANVGSNLPGPVLGLGIAVPGLVDTAEGTVLQAANLGWHDLPLAQIVSRRFGRPVVVDNDTNAAALGEFRFGAARGHRNVVYVRAGTGIGAGLILDGKLFRGELGLVGELGHTVLDPGGATCVCGRQGCLETLASVPAVLARYRATRGGAEKLSFKDLVSRAYSGDDAARVALREAGLWLGRALGNVANLLGPSAVLLAGPLAGGGPLLWEPLLAEFRHRVLSQAAGQIWVARGELKERAGTTGAAQLVFEQVFSEEHEEWLPALRQVTAGNRASSDEKDDWRDVGGGAGGADGMGIGS